tara:strand:- start:56 stop:238 length:183 start_codon:yes stop_codon:yes gene_type:complete
MPNFYSKEIESQYNLIKILLTDKKKYAGPLESIKKDISYMPIELKKKIKKENYFFKDRKE